MAIIDCEYLNDQMLRWLGEIELSSAVAVSNIYGISSDGALKINRRFARLAIKGLNLSMPNLSKISSEILSTRAQLLEFIEQSLTNQVAESSPETLLGCLLKYIDALRIVKNERKDRFCRGMNSLSSIPLESDWQFLCELLELRAVSYMGFEWMKLPFTGAGGAASVVEDINRVIADIISEHGLMDRLLLEFANVYEGDLKSDVKDTGIAKSEDVQKIIRRIKNADGSPVGFVGGKQFWMPLARTQWDKIEQIDCHQQVERIRSLVLSAHSDKTCHYLLTSFEMLDEGSQRYLLDRLSVTCCFDDENSFQKIDGGSFSRMNCTIDLAELENHSRTVLEGYPSSEEVDNLKSQIRMGEYGGYTDLLIMALIRVVAT